MGMKKGQKKKEGKKGEKQARKVVGSLESGSFSFLMVGQNWLSVSAAAEEPQRRTEAVMRMQQEAQIKERRWVV